jgi:hypothetical protein
MTREKKGRRGYLALVPNSLEIFSSSCSISFWDFILIFVTWKGLAWAGVTNSTSSLGRSGPPSGSSSRKSAFLISFRFSPRTFSRTTGTVSLEISRRV